MKTYRLMALSASVLVVMFTSCRHNALEIPAPLNSNDPILASKQAKQQPNPGPCNPNAYIVTLESCTQVDTNWVWVWSVQNPNPGNGNNGTSQDLSHWGMQFESCIIFSNIIGAAYSANGTNWNSFTPTYQVDPSQGCMTTAVLKFNFGTNGNAKSYYRIIVNTYYEADYASGYYKSGSNTGCCTFDFYGMACYSGHQQE